MKLVSGVTDWDAKYSLAAYAKPQWDARDERYELLVRLNTHTNMPLFMKAWWHESPERKLQSKLYAITRCTNH